MALSRNMKIGLIVLGVIFLLGALFGTLAATGVLSGQGTITTCTDSNDKCAEWASSGECDNNPDYMLTNCCASCESSDEEETTPAGSPSGTTTVSFPGCMDEDADNYNPEATEDDGSCIILGCMNEDADNYNPEATEDDGSCIILGCMDEDADNYNPEATEDDGSCIILGCTDPIASNYNPEATEDYDSCVLDNILPVVKTTSTATDNISELKRAISVGEKMKTWYDNCNLEGGNLTDDNCINIISYLGDNSDYLDSTRDTFSDEESWKPWVTSVRDNLTDPCSWDEQGTLGYYANQILTLDDNEQVAYQNALDGFLDTITSSYVIEKIPETEDEAKQMAKTWDDDYWNIPNITKINLANEIKGVYGGWSIGDSSDSIPGIANTLGICTTPDTNRDSCDVNCSNVENNWKALLTALRDS